jgi:hypothetical protein
MLALLAYKLMSTAEAIAKQAVRLAASREEPFAFCAFASLTEELLLLTALVEFEVDVPAWTVPGEAESVSAVQSKTKEAKLVF